jgi:hypothetical protein
VTQSTVNAECPFVVLHRVGGLILGSRVYKINPTLNSDNPYVQVVGWDGPVRDISVIDSTTGPGINGGDPGSNDSSLAVNGDSRSR